MWPSLSSSEIYGGDASVLFGVMGRGPLNSTVSIQPQKHPAKAVTDRVELLISDAVIVPRAVSGSRITGNALGPHGGGISDSLTSPA